MITLVDEAFRVLTAAAGETDLGRLCRTTLGIAVSPGPLSLCHGQDDCPSVTSLGSELLKLRMLLLALGKLTGPYARQPDRQVFLFLVSKQLEMQEALRVCYERLRASGWAALVEVRGVARQLFSNVLLNVANVVYGVCALAALAATPSEAPGGMPAATVALPPRAAPPMTPQRWALPEARELRGERHDGERQRPSPSAATPDRRHLAPVAREPGGGDANWYGCSPEPLAKRARPDSSFYT